MFVSKYSNEVPVRSSSMKSALTANDRRNGGRNTRKPEAAARLIPIIAASMISASFMVLGTRRPS